MAATPLSYYPAEDQLAARIKSFESGASLAAERVGSKENGKLPRSLDSPLAWSRQDIDKDMHQCVLKLSAADITSLEAAAKAFEGMRYSKFYGYFSPPLSIEQLLTRVHRPVYPLVRHIHREFCPSSRAERISSEGFRPVLLRPRVYRCTRPRARQI